LPDKPGRDAKAGKNSYGGGKGQEYKNGGAGMPLAPDFYFRKKFVIFSPHAAISVGESLVITKV